MAYKLLRAFQVTGFQKCPGDRESPYDHFMEAVYDATRGDRAASAIFSEDMLTPRKTIPVVEIPVYRPFKTRKGNEMGPEMEWGTVEDDDDDDGRRQISESSTNSYTTSLRDGTPFSSIEEADDFQDLLDAQLRFEGAELGIDATRPSPTPSVSNMPPKHFIRELQEQALLPTPSPLPPVGYSSSPVEHTAVPCSSSETKIIDLCDEDEQDEQDDEIYELPAFDLTQDEEDHHDEDQDCAIIGSATHGRGGHTALTIRSRSLSNTINTQTRPPKRGRGGKINSR